LIKIVQRVPVRIALNPSEVASHPLQIGLSMKARVDTHDRGGARLPQLAQNVPTYSTDVFGAPDELADQRVRQIIALNGAGAGEAHSKQAPTDTTAMNRMATVRAIPAIHVVPVAHTM